jgi:hypothetical protein
MQETENEHKGGDVNDPSGKEKRRMLYHLISF